MSQCLAGEQIFCPLIQRDANGIITVIAGSPVNAAHNKTDGNDFQADYTMDTFNGKLLKRLLVHVCAFNLGLWMRSLFGIGTPRALQGRLAILATVLSTLCSLTQCYRPRLASELPSGAIGTIGERIYRLCLKTALVLRAARL